MLCILYYTPIPLILHCKNTIHMYMLHIHIHTSLPLYSTYVLRGLPDVWNAEIMYLFVMLCGLLHSTGLWVPNAPEFEGSQYTEVR